MTSIPSMLLSKSFNSCGFAVTINVVNNIGLKRTLDSYPHPGTTWAGPSAQGPSSGLLSLLHYSGTCGCCWQAAKGSSAPRAHNGLSVCVCVQCVCVCAHVCVCVCCVCVCVVCVCVCGLTGAVAVVWGEAVLFWLSCAFPGDDKEAHVCVLLPGRLSAWVAVCLLLAVRKGHFAAAPAAVSSMRGSLHSRHLQFIWHIWFNNPEVCRPCLLYHLVPFVWFRIRMILLIPTDWSAPLRWMMMTVVHDVQYPVFRFHFKDQKEAVKMSSAGESSLLS